MEPKYIDGPLLWTPEMAARVAELADRRPMTVQVWLREAIREKLDRDDPGGGKPGGDPMGGESSACA
jgi:hypothetical protein